MGWPLQSQMSNSTRLSGYMIDIGKSSSLFRRIRFHPSRELTWSAGTHGRQVLIPRPNSEYVAIDWPSKQISGAATKQKVNSFTLVGSLAIG